MKYRVYFYIDYGTEDGPVLTDYECDDLGAAKEFAESIPNLKEGYWREFSEILKVEKIDFKPNSLKIKESKKDVPLVPESITDKWAVPIKGFF